MTADWDRELAKLADAMAVQTASEPPRDITIRVVPDEACPACGRVGRPKVGHEDGTWAWRCPSTREECPVAYYTPGRNPVTIEYKLSPEEQAASDQRVRDDVERMLRGKVFVERLVMNGHATEGRPVPEHEVEIYLSKGWHPLGTLDPTHDCKRTSRAAGHGHDEEGRCRAD